VETRSYCEPRVTGNQVVVRAMVLWKPEATASHGLLETKRDCEPECDGNQSNVRDKERRLGYGN